MLQTARWQQPSLGQSLSAQEAEAIYRLTSLVTYQERFVIPPMAREAAIEATTDPQKHKSETGFGKRRPARRGLVTDGRDTTA